MFFNNPTANFSRAGAGAAPTGPFNYDPMSDSSLGASSACFGITPLPDGGWSADYPLIVGSKIYYNSALNTEVSGSYGDTYWYSWIDTSTSPQTEYVYRYESGIQAVELCGSSSYAITWEFTVDAGATGSLKIFQNTVEIVNTSVSAGPNTFFASTLDDIKSEVSCSVPTAYANIEFQVSNPLSSNFDACDAGSSNNNTTTNFVGDGGILAEIQNTVACP